MLALNNSLLTSESFHGIREVAQEQGVLVSSPEDLSFIHEAHMMRKICRSSKLSFDLHEYCGTCFPPHTHNQSINQKAIWMAFCTITLYSSYEVSLLPY